MNAPDLDKAIARVDAAQSTVILRSGRDMQPQPVAWLWKDWLALGKLHILAGAPGQGKTTIAMALAATVTIGGRWPDGSRAAKGNVLVWSGEDDPADTLLPRLLAAGADRDRCHFIEGTVIDTQVQPFDPARDMNQLLAAIEQVGDVRLVIVDPVVSAVSGDSHKNAEVRKALQPLVDMAAAGHFAILGITHFAKGGQGQDPTQRVIGSVAFSAVARVVLVAAKTKTEEGEDARILARSKSNIGPDDGGFIYNLEQMEALPGIEASRVTWGKSVAGSARELLAEPEGEDEGQDAKDAVEMLREVLEGQGDMLMVEASKPLTAAGFTKKQIRTASQKLHVIRRKDGLTGGWRWRLPDANRRAFQPLHEDAHFPKVPEDAHSENRAPWAPSGAPSAKVSGSNEVIL